MSAMYCFITGASRGLGATLAKKFWSEGYNLVLVARDSYSLGNNLAPRSGQTIFRIGCDLSDLQVPIDLSRQVVQMVPKLDVVINNAAMQGPIGPIWESDGDAYRATLRVNLLAPIELCRAFVPWMGRTGGGSIINLSGGGATGPRPNFSAYAIAKTALVRFSETLAEEARSLGIRVNCVAPGAMKTDMLVEVAGKGPTVVGVKEYCFAQKVLYEGGASMEHVAKLCCLLATDAGKGITGKLISAVWDNWEQWPSHAEELASSDAYTLRRITGRDRGFDWGDK